MLHRGFKIKAALRTPGFWWAFLRYRLKTSETGVSKLIWESGVRNHVSLFYCKWIALLTDPHTIFFWWSVLTLGLEVHFEISWWGSAASRPVAAFHQWRYSCMSWCLISNQSLICYSEKKKLVWLQDHKAADVEVLEIFGREENLFVV